MKQLQSSQIATVAVALSLGVCGAQTNITESFEKLPCTYFTRPKRQYLIINLDIRGSQSMTLQPGKAHEENVQDCMRICSQEPLCQGFEYYRSPKKCVWKSAVMPIANDTECQIDFYRLDARICQSRPASPAHGYTGQRLELPRRRSHPLSFGNLKFFIFQPSWARRPLRAELFPHNTVDYQIKPNPAEHLIDLEVQQLYSSKHRTRKLKEAQFVVIDAPVISAKVFQLYIEHILNHKKRWKATEMVESYTEKLVRELRATTAWKQKKPHHLWYGGFNFIRGMGDISQLGLGPSTPLTLMTTDLYPLLRHYDTLPLVRQSVVPFVHTWRYTLTSPPDLRLKHKRPCDVMFRGNLDRTHDGAFRTGLLKLRDKLKSLGVITNINDVDFKHYKGVRDMIDDTVRQVLKTKLCLIPAGDTPSSRRVYDALAGGCVPVIMSRNVEESLPFRSIIKWRSIAIFFSTMRCVSECADVIATKIHKILQQPEQLYAMQQQGMKTFNKYLKYNGQVAKSYLKSTYDETVLGLDWVHHPLFKPPKRWHPAQMSSLVFITTRDGGVRGTICNAAGLAISNLRALAARITSSSESLPQNNYPGVYACSGEKAGFYGDENKKAISICAALQDRRTMAKSLSELVDDENVPMVMLVRNPVLRFLSATTNQSQTNVSADDGEYEVSLLRRFVEHPDGQRPKRFQVQSDFCGARYYPSDIILRYSQMELDLKRSRDEDGNGGMTDASPPDDRDLLPEADNKAACSRLLRFRQSNRGVIKNLVLQAYQDDYAAFKHLGDGFSLAWSPNNCRRIVKIKTPKRLFTFRGAGVL